MGINFESLQKRSKEEIYNMLRYVLTDGDVEDENLLSDWTDVLFELHRIRQKFPRPTTNLIEVDKDIHQMRVMNISSGGVKISSNHSDFWVKNDNPDISVFGDVTIENSEKNLKVIGNVNGNVINSKGDIISDTLCNVGNLVVNCNTLNVDSFRVSGNITINAKDIIISDYRSEKSNINGNVTSSFFSSNETEIKGNVKSTFIEGTNDDNFKVDFNKP